MIIYLKNRRLLQIDIKYELSNISDMSRQDMMIPMDPTHAACTFTVAEKLKHIISQLKFGKIETKKNPVISEEIGIKASPHASKVLFKDGKVIDIINAGK